MKFTKTLLATVLLAGASVSAQAALLGTSDAYLSVYDGVGKTYDLNLGSVLGLNYANLQTHASVSYDLSQDSTWNTFAGANDANLGSALFFVGASNSGTAFEYTSNNAASVTFTNAVLKSTSLNAVGSSGQVGRINLSLTATTNSAIVTDANADQGGWAASSAGIPVADTLWGKNANASAGIGYGSTGNFFNAVAGTPNTYSNIGTWTLTGNNLIFTSATASAVPLPTAVWMFGAGLMGLLGATRRKSAAV